jgi:hypothetical protein
VTAAEDDERDWSACKAMTADPEGGIFTAVTSWANKDGVDDIEGTFSAATTKADRGGEEDRCRPEAIAVAVLQQQWE